MDRGRARPHVHFSEQQRNVSDVVLCEEHLGNLRPLSREGCTWVRGCSGETTVFPSRHVGALLCSRHVGSCFRSPGNKCVPHPGHTNHSRAPESSEKGPFGHTKTSVSSSSMSG